MEPVKRKGWITKLGKIRTELKKGNNPRKVEDMLDNTFPNSMLTFVGASTKEAKELYELMLDFEIVIKGIEKVAGIDLSQEYLEKNANGISKELVLLESIYPNIRNKIRNMIKFANGFEKIYNK